VTTTDHPYRYELWKLKTNTLVHCRVTGQVLDSDDPTMIERGPFAGYPSGYEWRVYQRDRELARWAATDSPERDMSRAWAS
jgi:hypothetical protein